MKIERGRDRNWERKLDTERKKERERERKRDIKVCMTFVSKYEEHKYDVCIIVILSERGLRQTDRVKKLDRERERKRNIERKLDRK